MGVAGHVGPEGVDHLVQFLVVDTEPERHRSDAVGPAHFRQIGQTAGPFEFEARTQRHQAEGLEIIQSLDVLRRRVDLDVAEPGEPAEQRPPDRGAVRPRDIDGHRRLPVTDHQGNADDRPVDHRHPRADLE